MNDVDYVQQHTFESLPFEEMKHLGAHQRWDIVINKPRVKITRFNGVVLQEKQLTASLPEKMLFCFSYVIRRVCYLAFRILNFCLSGLLNMKAVVKLVKDNDSN